MDYEISGNFKDANKTIIGLKTLDELSMLFEEISLNELKQAVNIYIESKRSENKDFIKLCFEFYFYNNYCPYKLLDKLGKQELTTRNNLWLEKILSATQEDIICIGYTSI